MGPIFFQTAATAATAAATLPPCTTTVCFLFACTVGDQAQCLAYIGRTLQSWAVFMALTPFSRLQRSSHLVRVHFPLTSNFPDASHGPTLQASLWEVHSFWLAGAISTPVSWEFAGGPTWGKMSLKLKPLCHQGSQAQASTFYTRARNAVPISPSQRNFTCHLIHGTHGSMVLYDVRRTGRYLCGLHPQLQEKCHSNASRVYKTTDQVTSEWSETSKSS